MKMAVWMVPAEAQGLAARVPKGKLFGSGRALAPLINAKLMAELEGEVGKSSHAGVPQPADGAGKGPAEPAGADFEASGHTPTSSKPAGPSAAPTRPTDWGSIGVGSEVLADCGQPGLGWYEAVVIAHHGDHLFDVRWIKYPDEPTVMRHRNDLGLLAPKHIIERA